MNEGDATVAMQSWREAVVKQTGFDMDVHVSALAAMVREVREHRVDGFSVTTLRVSESGKLCESESGVG